MTKCKSPDPREMVGRRPTVHARMHAALLCILLFALSWQSYLVGTHAHQPSVLSTPPGQVLNRTPAHERRAPAAPDSCPICQQISIAAAYLPAPPATFATPVRMLAWYGGTPALDRLPRQHSHGWHSRGPPAAPIRST